MNQSLSFTGAFALFALVGCSYQNRDANAPDNGDHAKSETTMQSQGRRTNDIATVPYRFPMTDGSPRPDARAHDPRTETGANDFSDLTPVGQRHPPRDRSGFPAPNSSNPPLRSASTPVVRWRRCVPLGSPWPRSSLVVAGAARGASDARAAVARTGGRAPRAVALARERQRDGSGSRPAEPVGGRSGRRRRSGWRRRASANASSSSGIGGFGGGCGNDCSSCNGWRLLHRGLFERLLLLPQPLQLQPHLLEQLRRRVRTRERMHRAVQERRLPVRRRRVLRLHVRRRELRHQLRRPQRGLHRRLSQRRLQLRARAAPAPSRAPTETATQTAWAITPPAPASAHRTSAFATPARRAISRASRAPAR